MPHKYIYHRKIIQIKSNIKCQMQLTYELELYSSHVIYFHIIFPLCHMPQTHTLTHSAIFHWLLLLYVHMNMRWISGIFCANTWCVFQFIVCVRAMPFSSSHFFLYTRFTHWTQLNQWQLALSAYLYMIFFLKNREKCNRKCKQYEQKTFK